MAKKELYYIINKPYGVLSQFTSESGHPSLGELYTVDKSVYPVGRLDRDSEGLLILTNDRKLNSKLLHPQNRHKRTYWAEVEGIPDAEALKKLQQGVEINLKGKLHQTLPASARSVEVSIAEREVPVNRKKHPITSWIEVGLIEGKNRQVRKMTASVGHPTLRLLRVRIEDLDLGNLKSGEITQISKNVLYKKLKIS